MADNKTDWPLGVLVAAGVVGAIMAFGWALAQIIPALGVAAGLATSLTATGLVGAPGAAAWWGPAAAVGLGGGGAAGFTWLMVKVVREAPKDPYKYTLPILGIVGSLFLDLAKDYAIDNQLLKILLSAILAFSVVVAGACYESGSLLWKGIAILLLLAPPGAILVRNLNRPGVASMQDAFVQIPGAVWIRLVGFLVISTVVLVLFHLDSRQRSSQRA